ncbi:hypothetical protein ACH4C2_13815 [Streptomyces sp. NPDC018057]|uniref:hypothetical protein n=1 Tax=unclassified Streptomyces TaxID=2593676 RepID=UPI0037B5AF55
MTDTRRAGPRTARRPSPSRAHRHHPSPGEPAPGTRKPGASAPGERAPDERAPGERAPAGRAIGAVRHRRTPTRDRTGPEPQADPVPRGPRAFGPVAGAHRTTPLKENTR